MFDKSSDGIDVVERRLREESRLSELATDEAIEAFLKSSRNSGLQTAFPGNPPLSPSDQIRLEDCSRLREAPAENMRPSFSFIK